MRSRPTPSTIHSRVVPTEYDVESGRGLRCHVLIDDRGRRFSGLTLAGALRRAERAQDPRDPIHHPPFPSPSEVPAPARRGVAAFAQRLTTHPRPTARANFTREQLLDAAASETVSFRIGEPEVERAHLAGMSALIAQLTVGEGSFTDVQNETRAEIERRAIAQGAPYSL